MNKLNSLTFNPLKQTPEPTIPTTTKHFNAIINRLSSQGSHQEVLVTYFSMLKTNTLPDSYSFPSLFKACTFLRLFSQGLSFHQCVIVNGFSSDAYISSSLINFYSKFGRTNHAHKVFDRMPDKNVVPWTAIIGCYACSGDIYKAFSLFSQMRHEGTQFSSVPLLSLLCGVSELAQVRCLHGCVISYGFESDVTLMNSTLNVYGKCGGIVDARFLFEFMNQRDIVTWNSLISGYSQSGNVREVIQLLCRMKFEGMEPDKKTFGSVVSVIATESNLKLGKLVHGQILRSGFELDTQIETVLIVMYLKCKSIDTAFRIFKYTSKKDVVIWTAMISGLVQINCADRALDIFCQMVKSRMEPSTSTIATALAACAQLGSLNRGTSIHCYVLREGIAQDTPSQNSLITMYAKCGRLYQSRAIFERMEKRDLVSWNAMVAGYAQNGQFHEGLFIFSEMRATLQKPDSITIVSLLQVCASIGALDQGKWIHNFVIRSYLRPCILVDTALVDMYSKCGDIQTAQKCFDEMSEHDVISWGTIISGYGCHGKGETALRMYSEFLRTGNGPDRVIFLSVLSACSHNGLVDHGMRLYQTMSEVGITPSLEHHACIVDLLCRAGRVEEAYNFYKRTFSEPSVDVLGILLDAFRWKVNVELRELIARDLFMLRPTDAGNYVQLAHSYASMNRWDSVGEAWMQMRSLGLKKLPGWSSIDLQGTITTFFMDHNSHPQYDCIISALKTLTGEMRKLASNSSQMHFLNDELEDG